MLLHYIMKNIKKLENIILTYIRKNQERSQKEIDYFKNMSNIDLVIKNAAFAINEKGKRFNHQRRINNKILQFIYQKLIENKDKLIKLNNFDEVYALIDSIKVKGYSYLSIYDTALRISSFLEYEPDKIYLHRGTLTGVKALGINTKNKKYILKKDLPIEFNKLKEREIEDVLCIYKKYLNNVE